MSEDITRKIINTVLIIFTLALLLIVPWAGTFLNSIGSNYGQKTGYVVAVGHTEGLFWSADVVYFTSDTESGLEEKYCVNDIELKDELEIAADLKRLTTIIYANDFLFYRSICDGGKSVIVGMK